MESFSDRLRGLISEEKPTMKALAEAAGVTTRALQLYMRSERQPTLSVLTGLADYFSVSIDYLVGRTDDPTLHHLPVDSS